MPVAPDVPWSTHPEYEVRGIVLTSPKAVTHGASSEVYEGLYRGEKVALKRPHAFVPTFGNEELWRNVLLRVALEVAIQELLEDGPHIMEFLGVNEEIFPTPCIVTLWAANNTIRHYRNSLGAGNINIEKRLTEISIGLEYIHSKEIAHNALSSSTIFILMDGTACIGGFGLAELPKIPTAVGSDSHLLVGEFTEPRGMQSPFAVDVYAFACVAFQLYTGRSPYSFIRRELMRAKGGVELLLRPTHYEDSDILIPNEIWDLIERSWEPEIPLRYTSSQVLKHMEIINQEWNTKSWTKLEPAVVRWFFDSNSKSLCWVEISDSSNGSYLARCMSELCAREHQLGGSIFFSQENSMDAMTMISKFIRELSYKVLPTTIARYMQEALRENPELLYPQCEKDLKDCLSAVIIQPLQTRPGSFLSPLVIVLDSLELWEGINLDHTTDSNGWFTKDVLVRSIFWLSETLQKERINLRFFVTSGTKTHRDAKSSLQDFQKYTHSLYLHPHGVLDSSNDAWSELQTPGADNQNLVHRRSTDISDESFPGIEWCGHNEYSTMCWMRHPSLQYGRPSAAARAAARHCQNKGSLAAYLICSSPNINNQGFFKNLASQLGSSIPGLKPRMRRILDEQRETLFATDEEFCRTVILQAFSTDEPPPPMVIVIDTIGFLYRDFPLAELVWLEGQFSERNIPLRLCVASELDLYRWANFQFPEFMDRALLLKLQSDVVWRRRLHRSQRSLTFNHSTQLLHQNLIDFIIHQLSADYSKDQTLHNTFEAVLADMTPLDRVQSFVKSDEFRSRLLTIITDIGLSEHDGTKKALKVDEHTLAKLLENIVDSEPDKSQLLSLAVSEMSRALDLMQIIFSKGLIESAETNRKARRLFIKLSQHADIILPSQLITGLTLLNEGRPVNGGGYADIFQALYQGNEVAVKRIRTHFVKDSQNIRRAFAGEALVWQHLKHPNVLPFLGIDAEMFTSSLCMVSPWMHHGTIMEFRAMMGPAHINIEQRLSEILMGLLYLHGEGVIHGDLRGGNILIDDTWHAVLADFGLTVFSDATAATHETNPRGTCRWMAPELLIPDVVDVNSLRKTEASDVYAFGCVCLELYTGLHPFSEASTDVAVICQLIMGKRPSLAVLDSTDNSPQALFVPDSIREMVDRCLQRDTKDRPLVLEIIETLKVVE
ncbi:kinase-like domain-containing protein [Crucibulum laeve]|uniref:Kinase-like domain-containing protein n=1 Tax=Crucibulum laeve TaxID=68775 RepID=A0A5C3M5F1_9AGAR|nr:kinase-like domain-containing protein [Crucibulum laeve]